MHIIMCTIYVAVTSTTTMQATMVEDYFVSVSTKALIGYLYSQLAMLSVSYVIFYAAFEAIC